MEMLLVSTNRRLFLLSAVFAMVAIPLAGCGGPPPEPVGSLTGVVTSGGEICGDCNIAVYNPATLKSHGGRVDSEGRYEVKNLPFGEYTITMVQKPTNAVVEVFDKRIPKKYRDPKTSGLAASVTSDAPVEFNVEM